MNNERWTWSHILGLSGFILLNFQYLIKHTIKANKNKDYDQPRYFRLHNSGEIVTCLSRIVPNSSEILQWYFVELSNWTSMYSPNHPPLPFFTCICSIVNWDIWSICFSNKVIRINHFRKFCNPSLNLFMWFLAYNYWSFHQISSLFQIDLLTDNSGKCLLLISICFHMEILMLLNLVSVWLLRKYICTIELTSLR